MGTIRPSLPSWRLSGLPRFQVLKKRSVGEWLLFVTLIVYIGGCVVLYFAKVQPWMDGTSNIRVGADSDHYWDEVNNAREGVSVGQLIGLSTNFLGPVAIGLALKSGFAVLCFNVGLFLIALRVAFSIEGLNQVLFGALMLLNAELIPSLTTLNKEILAILAAVLSAKYVYSSRHSTLLLACTLITSLFARWEQLVIFVFFLMLLRSPLRRRPRLAVGLIIAAFTVIYPVMFRILGIDTSIFDYVLAGAGLVLKLDSIQAAYGFPLVLPVKILMTIAGRVPQPSFWTEVLSGVDSVDLQRDIFQPLGCVAVMIVFTVAVYKGKMRVSRPIGLLSAITLVVVAVAPFIQARYVISVYVLLSIELAKDSGEPSVVSSSPRKLSDKTDAGKFSSA